MRSIQVNQQTINIAEDEPKLFTALATRIAEMAHKCVADDNIFSIALSGGNTPRGLYGHLAKFSAEQFPWNSTFLFLGDERCVPHADGESNYKMISDSLLSHISIPATNVYPTINQDKDPEDSAKRYEQSLRRFFKMTEQNSLNEQNKSGEKQWPRLSLALMGLGNDGHTASLFPGTLALEEQGRLCVANHVPQLDTTRLTLTRPVFAHAKKIFFLAAGESKAEIFADVIMHSEKKYPSQLVISDCPEGSVEWFVDESCARLLKVNK